MISRVFLCRVVGKEKCLGGGGGGGGGGGNEFIDSGIQSQSIR